MISLSWTEEFLHNLLKDIMTYLSHELRLSIKSTYQLFPVDARGIDFVGYVFFHHKTRLRKSIKQSFARKLARNAPQKSIASYWGWAKHCDSRHLIKKLMK